MAEHMETNNVKGKRILLLCEPFSVRRYGRENHSE